MAVWLDDDCNASSDDLRSALEASGVVGTWDWDIVSRRALYDRGAARLLALDPELAGQHLYGEAAMVGIHPDDRQWLVEELDRVLAGGGLFVAEYRVVTRQHSTRWLLSRGRIYQDNYGRPIRSKGVIIDITESHEDSEGFLASPVSRGRKPFERAASALLDARRALDELGAEMPSHLRVVLDLALFEVGTHLAKDERH